MKRGVFRFRISWWYFIASHGVAEQQPATAQHDTAWYRSTEQCSTDTSQTPNRQGLRQTANEASLATMQCNAVHWRTRVEQSRAEWSTEQSR